MSDMSKQKALDWLVSSVKQWPAVGEGKRPQSPDSTCWHFDLASNGWQLYVGISADDSAFITQGDWAIEKARIASEKRKIINERFERKMKNKDYFRWNGRIPNTPDAKAKMASLAAKLRKNK